MRLLPLKKGRALRESLMPNTFDQRFLFFDTETTGVDPEDARIVELGAAYFEGRQFTEHRRMLVNPGVPIPKEASAIHGITDERVADKPPFAEVAPAFVAHLDGSALSGPAPLLGGYNARSYDAPLINAELQRVGVHFAIDEALVYDPIVFVRYHLRHLRNRTLSAIAEAMGVRLINAHSAVADAIATGEIFFKMVERGMIPDDPAEALRAQDTLSKTIDEEWERYGYWLYHHRSSGELFMGAGKYCGLPLAEVDPGYLDYLIGVADDLPKEVRAAFEATLSR